MGKKKKTRSVDLLVKLWLIVLYLRETKEKTDLERPINVG